MAGRRSVPEALTRAVDPGRADSLEYFSKMLSGLPDSGAAEGAQREADGTGTQIAERSEHATPNQSSADDVTPDAATPDDVALDAVTLYAARTDASTSDAAFRVELASDPAPMEGTATQHFPLPDSAYQDGELGRRDRQVDAAGERLVDEARSDPNGNAEQRNSGRGPRRRTTRRGVLPEVPAARVIPVFLDASYAPRQVFLRVTKETRDRMRQLKQQRAGGGEDLTDGGAVEEGCRLLPDTIEELAALYVTYASRRDKPNIAMAPLVRQEIHAWLHDAVVALGEHGIRASVNQLAQLSISQLTADIAPDQEE